MIKDIKSIEGHESLTSQQIADALQATGVTATAIKRADLVHLLNMRGMLRKIVSNNTDEKWTGTVLNMQDAILASGTQQQKDGIRLWFSHITNVSNLIWDTTKPEFAAPFWQMYQTFADQIGMPTSEDFQLIAELGGGWKYSELTPEHVSAAISSAELADRKQALESQAVDALQSFREALASWDGLGEAPKIEV